MGLCLRLAPLCVVVVGDGDGAAFVQRRASFRATNCCCATRAMRTTRRGRASATWSSSTPVCSSPDTRNSPPHNLCVIVCSWYHHHHHHHHPPRSLRIVAAKSNECTCVNAIALVAQYSLSWGSRGRWPVGPPIIHQLQCASLCGEANSWVTRVAAHGGCALVKQWVNDGGLRRRLSFRKRAAEGPGTTQTFISKGTTTRKTPRGGG